MQTQTGPQARVRTAPAAPAPTSTGAPAPTFAQPPLQPPLQRPAKAAGKAPTPRRKSAPRPVPVASEDYAHLSIDGLRAYRRTLSDEESKVSYWRRILQARLDLVSSGTTSKPLDHERLTPLLTSERIGAGRTALVEVLPIDDIPPLPRLDELWDRRVGAHDEQGREELERDLQEAEAQLSDYRSALHRRISEATDELIARYREEPTLCLSSLPLRPAARPRRD